MKSNPTFEDYKDNIPAQTWLADPNGHILSINTATELYLGKKESEIIGTEWLNFIHEDDLDSYKTAWKQALLSRSTLSAAVRLKNHNAGYDWFFLLAKPVFDAGKNIVEWVGNNTAIHVPYADIGQRDRLVKLLKESQEIAEVGGWELNVSSGDLYWTDQTYRLHDTSPEEFDPTVDAGVEYYLPESRDILSQAIDDAIQRGKDYDLELESYTTKGRRISVRTTCRVTKVDGQVVKLTGIFQDITKQKQILEELKTTNARLSYLNNELAYLTDHDPLTRLPNRILLADRLKQAMYENDRRETSTAVVFFDLDNFKLLNDSYGQEAGDKALVDLGRRLSERLRRTDTVARIGGDEFVAILTDLKDETHTERLIQQLRETIAEPFGGDGLSLALTAGFGVTLYPQNHVDADQLLRNADQAMYRAKQAGKNSIHYFDESLDTKVKQRFKALDDIRDALEQNQFVLYYQPKVDLQTGAVLGAEALIRWQHPSEGVLNPANFLPVIEGDLLSVQLGEWVIRRALKQIEEWQSKGLHLPVSVNVGAMQLRQPEFVFSVRSLLQQFPQVKASDLQIEVLETSALGDVSKVSKIIEKCNEIGVTFAIDDFGTGYSSLTYLKQLPVDVLKIDQSFVRDIAEDSEDRLIIDGIINLAKSFGRQPIAEGVESIEQGRELIAMGCVNVQGYAIARPMPADEIIGWVEQWRSEARWERFSSTTPGLVNTETPLAMSNSIARSIIDATPFPIAVVDRNDDKILYWSRNALVKFGHTARSASRWYELAYPDPVYRAQVVERWKPFLEEASKNFGVPINTGEYQVTCKDGSELTCELYATFLPDTLIVTFNDITVQKAAENQLLLDRDRLEERVISRTGELELANQKLIQLAQVDGLTHISNRGYFDWFFQKEWTRQLREQGSVGLMICDVDFFKDYNDNFGHLAGDEALRKIATLLSDFAKRPGDLAARYGGEEFVLLLPQANSESLHEMAQSLIEKVTSLRIPHAPSTGFRHLSVSVGACAVVPRHGLSREDLLARADKNLYKAKRKGRNTAVITEFDAD